MAGGGGTGNTWIYILVGGGVTIGIGTALHDAMPTWLIATLLAAGGLAVVFGSCEAMIKSVEGLGERLGWNDFVAGTMAGLASNIPELVMLGFVLAAEPRVGFVVVALTLHLGALAFGVYSALLPRVDGTARLPEPLVKLSTDLYACAGAAMLATGSLMVMMKVFEKPGTVAELSALDLYVMGGALIIVEVIAVVRLVARFSGGGTNDDVAADGNVDATVPDQTIPDQPAGKAPPSVGAIVGFGALGIGTSVVGGHAVGDFADILVQGLATAGYSKMVGALIISIFAMAGVYVMIATAHMKGQYDIALANVSGAVTQVPFVVMPIALILIAAFHQLGVVPELPGGGALEVDFHTTGVFLLAFGPMLILWKSVQDDGTVNWVETASMVAIFALTIYFIVDHG